MIEEIYQYISLLKRTDVLTPVISAHALPMFREGRQTSTRKQEEKARKDPVKSHRPDLPVHGPGTYFSWWLITPSVAFPSSLIFWELITSIISLTILLHYDIASE